MKRLLKKQSSDEVKYIALSPIYISITNETDEKYSCLLSRTHNEYANTIEEKLRSDSVELAKYINKSENLINGLIEKITLTLSNDNKLQANIIANQELNNEQLEQLKDYLTGQYSDGYGEGFEQQPLDVYDDEYEEESFDEDEEECYTETFEERVYVYAQLWRSDSSWNIEIKKA